MIEKTKRRLWVLGGVTAGCALFAVGYAPLISPYEGFEITPLVLVQFALHGALFGFLFGLFEIFYAQGAGAEWFRRQPLPISLLVKSIFTTILIVAILLLGGVLIFPDRFAQENAVQYFVRDSVVAFGMALVIQLILTVRAAIGGRVLGNLIIGRYHRPLKEDRIFLFLDLAGSTALAERLGDVEAQKLITRFFFDVAQVTVAFGGETHRYIGDEVVVTWPARRGIQNAACLRCCFAIADRIAERAADYQRRFGVAPSYRIGLHGGSVVASECGDDKHEIVYFGDTINTAARIEQYCKDAGRSLLISGDLLSSMILPHDWKPERIGQIQLRGRSREIDLFGIARA